MPDIKLEVKGKSFSKGLKSSLASRFISITLGFLVLPFVLLSIILYAHEYYTNKRNNFRGLALVANQVRSVIDEYIVGDTNLLSTLSFFLSDTDILDSASSEAQLAKMFNSLRKNDHVSNIIYAEWSGSKLVTRVSGAGAPLVNDLAPYFSKFRSIRDTVYFTTYPVKGSNENAMLIARNIPLNKHTGGDGVLFFVVSPGEFHDKLEQRTQILYPISVSIITPTGDVILSSREDFFNKRFLIDRGGADARASTSAILLEPAQDHQNYYTFVFNGDQKMAIYLPLEDQYRVLVEMSENTNIIDVSKYFMHILLIFFVIVFGGTIGTIWLTVRISQPLQKLCTLMVRIGKGDRSLRYIPDRMGFEINLVGRVLNQMLEGINRQIEEIKKERGEKETLSRELLIGQKIQTSLLPTRIPSVPSLRIAAGFLSAKEVGGDFYDVFIRDDKEVLLCMSDAAGKGVAACLFSLSLRSILRSHFQAGLSFKEILVKANNLCLLDTEPTSSFLTLWFGIYDIEKQELTYANCGHHPAIIKKKDGTFLELKAHDMAIGVMEFTDVQTETVKLEPEDLLLLYTDGIAEAHNQEGEQFGINRMQSVLSSVASGEPQEIMDTLMQETKRFSKGIQQEDDMTALTVKILPLGGQQAPPPSS